MCRVNYYRSRECGHEWYQLYSSCGPGMNLLTCPDFSDSQPFGAAKAPRRRCWAPPYDCPSCDYDSHDMRRRRMAITKRTGWRIGLGSGKRDVGVDVYPTGAMACCVIM